MCPFNHALVILAYLSRPDHHLLYHLNHSQTYPLYFGDMLTAFQESDRETCSSNGGQTGHVGRTFTNCPGDRTAHQSLHRRMDTGSSPFIAPLGYSPYHLNDSTFTLMSWFLDCMASLLTVSIQMNPLCDNTPIFRTFPHHRRCGRAMQPCIFHHFVDVCFIS